LWTSAVETDPENTLALSNLALVYLHFNPPKTDQALVYLNRALQLSQAKQAKIAGGKQLDLSPIYQDLGEAYLAQASGLAAGTPGSDVWQQRKEAYVEPAKYFALASQNLSDFAPSDARLFSRLAEVYEGQAEMDAQDLAGATPGQLDSLVRQRDELRSKAEEAMRRAREILVAGNVSSIDTEYRAVILGEGNIFFGREVGASNEEKAVYYGQALSRCKEAGALFPDDPRPFVLAGCRRRQSLTPSGVHQTPCEREYRDCLERPTRQYQR